MRLAADDLGIVSPPEFHWLPDWTGRQVIVLASGPSARDVDLGLGRHRAQLIAVNNSYKLAPWADMLYGCDARWWKNEKFARHYNGLRVSQDRNAPILDPTIKKIHTVRGSNKMLFDTAGYVGWFGNGGMQAVNLAAQLGVRKILLVGLDLTLKNGSHWHGNHSNNLPNPRDHIVDRWRLCMDAMKPLFDERDIKVINCSFRSALEAYPKMELEEALNV